MTKQGSAAQGPCRMHLKQGDAAPAPKTRGPARCRTLGNNRLTGTLPAYFNGLCTMAIVAFQNNLLTGMRGSFACV